MTTSQQLFVGRLWPLRSVRRSWLGPAPGGRSAIDPADLREWLTYIASDELQGRAVYTGARSRRRHTSRGTCRPGASSRGRRRRLSADRRVQGVKATSRSTVTVQVGGESRTFKDGEGITFPRNIGGKRTLDGRSRRVRRVRSRRARRALHRICAGKDIEDAAVVFLGTNGPNGTSTGDLCRRLVGGRGRWPTTPAQCAAAAIGPAQRRAAEARREHASPPGRTRRGPACGPTSRRRSASTCRLRRRRPRTTPSSNSCSAGRQSTTTS